MFSSTCGYLQASFYKYKVENMALCPYHISEEDLIRHQASPQMSSKDNLRQHQFRGSYMSATYKVHRLMSPSEFGVIWSR